MKFIQSFTLTTALLVLILVGNVQAQSVAIKKDGKWSYVTVAGVALTTTVYDDAFPFYGGAAVAQDKELFGVLNTKGKWSMPPAKERLQAEINSNRIVFIDQNNKRGAIDPKGKIHVAATYDAMTPFLKGLALAGKSAPGSDLLRVVVVDTLGVEVVAFDNIFLPAKSFETGKRVREGYVSVLVDGDFGDALIKSDIQIGGRLLSYALLDVRNKKLINAPIPSLETEVREGRLNLIIDGIAYSWSAPLPIDPELSKAKFSLLTSTIHSFSGGVAAVIQHGNWAFVDKDGSLISETNLPANEYTSSNPLYSGGFVIFQKRNGKYIFTDLNGNQKIALEFDDVAPFQNGFAVAKVNGKFGLLQKDGSWALSAEYEDVRF